LPTVQGGACARIVGNAAVTRTTVFDSALPSTWIRAAGLPELDRVAFGIGQPGEASVGVDLRVQVDRDASFAKLSDHLVEVVDAEVDHPLKPPVATAAAPAIATRIAVRRGTSDDLLMLFSGVAADR